MPKAGFAAVAVLSAALGANAAGTHDGATSDDAAGLQHGVVFAEYSPLARSAEIARRMLSPLNYENIVDTAARSRLALREQTVDISRESFAVYVPRVAVPPKGYGLLVFIPPWQQAELPSGWAEALDKHGMIFVTAANSGNPENVFERRVPLALLGAHNIMRRYPIDKDRVYIGGMSGGSRVAMRVALAYADLFRGAFLNAGSDAIGTSAAVLPQLDVFELFQESRLVYVTGTEDGAGTDNDISSRRSMSKWCVFQTSSEPLPRLGHEIAPAGAFDHALSTLDDLPAVDPGKLGACRQRIGKEVSNGLHGVSNLLDRGQPRDAWKKLLELDSRYGGLAAPGSVELSRRIGDQH
jgi:hypothetical protein